MFGRKQSVRLVEGNSARDILSSFFHMEAPIVLQGHDFAVVDLDSWEEVKACAEVEKQVLCASQAFLGKHNCSVHSLFLLVFLL